MSIPGSTRLSFTERCPAGVGVRETLPPATLHHSFVFEARKSHERLSARRNFRRFHDRSNLPNSSELFRSRDLRRRTPARQQKEPRARGTTDREHKTAALGRQFRCGATRADLSVVHNHFSPSFLRGIPAPNSLSLSFFLCLPPLFLFLVPSTPTGETAPPHIRIASWRTMRDRQLRRTLFRE